MLLDSWIWLVTAYSLGSIPFGLLLTKIAGEGDIRQIGSGNIGATNVLRTGRKGLAAVTLLLDVAKGIAAVLLCRHFAPELAPLAGLIAVLGHNFPIWLKFRGGKGVATTLGVIIILDPLVGGLLISTWDIVFGFTRISSMAALVASLCAPFYAFLLSEENIFWMILVLSVLLIIRHHTNIKRLITGDEGRSRLRGTGPKA